MPNFFYLTLDTTPAANPMININGGATFATNVLADLTISTSDTDKTGYQMKIWGNVDKTYDVNIQDTEAASVWITYNNSKQIKLATGDGTKTINLKIRDDVYNESAVVSDTINLDTTIPAVSVTSADVTKISKQAGKNAASFSFSVDKAFVEYKVKVVSSTGAAENTGTTIAIAGGSTNTSGTGSYPSGTPIIVTIKGSDLESASSGDGQKIIKVFVKDASGKWSA